MTNRTKWIITVATGVAVAVIGGGVAVAAAEGDTPITGPALEKASAVALAYAGGGRVTGTEVGDEDSYYEVEVTRPDGSQIDVQLDANFTVVGSMPDREDPGSDG